MADSTPTDDAANVMVSCSVIELQRQVGLGESHSGSASVRVFEPGASRAIHQCERTDHVACDA